MWLVLAVVASGCQSPLRPADITYEVTGSATRATVSFSNAHGTSKATNIVLPWAYAFSAEPKEFLYLSAQVIRGDGSVTVSIRKGARVWKSAIAAGLQSTATASGPLE